MCARCASIAHLVAWCAIRYCVRIAVFLYSRQLLDVSRASSAEFHALQEKTDASDEGTAWVLPATSCRGNRTPRAPSASRPASTPRSSPRRRSDRQPPTSPHASAPAASTPPITTPRAPQTSYCVQPQGVMPTLSTATHQRCSRRFQWPIPVSRSRICGLQARPSYCRTFER